MYKENLNKSINESGITLVALIITIIVLVILAAVSVAAVYNSKIVEYAVNGSIDYTTQAVKENQILKGSVDIIESGIGKIQEIVGDSGNTPVTSTPVEPPAPPVQGKPVDELAIGAYVSYVPKAAEKYDIPASRVCDDNYITATQEFHSHTSTDTTSPNTDWRIWDKSADNHIRLISTKASTDTIQFHGANGYNNAVGTLNETCQIMYSHSDYATAKSIDMDDIDAIATGVTKTSSSATDTAPSLSSSPKIYDYERNNSVNRSWQGTSNSALDWYLGTSSESYIPRWTYYSHKLEDLPNIDAQPYRALLAQQVTNTTAENNPSSYWVASRCVQFNSSHASFQVFNVYIGNISCITLCPSAGTLGNGNFVLRPIVTLDLTKCAIGTDTTTDGTMEHPYNIVKK